MIDKAIVKMWGTKIGEIKLLEDGYCSFKYDKNFVKSGIEVSPLRMPLSDNTYVFRDMPLDTFSGLPGLFYDSFPDKFGNSIIDEWLSRNGKSMDDFGAIDKLLYIGKRSMGALEYYPVKKIETVTNVDVDRMVELCNQILAEKEKIDVKDSEMSNLIKIGTSAGGARAKAIVAYNKTFNSFKSGQIDAGDGYDYYIIKFDGVKNKDKDKLDSIFATRIEYAYYLMAKIANINISDSSLLIRDDKYHFMTKRFDRYKENGKLMKRHMQSLCAIGHIPFNETRIFSYEATAQLMKRINVPASDIEELFKRMVFNVCFINHDDHVKNISFIMDRVGKWRLSPFYDVTYMYDPNGKWTNEHQMLINGKSKNINLVDIFTAGKNMDIKEIRMNQIIDDIRRAMSQFPKIGKEAHLPDEVIEELKNKFIKL